MAAMGPLERRRRAASRIALYGSLALVGALAGMLVEIVSRPLAQGIREQWHTVDWAAKEEVQLLQEYVRIDTSARSGNVARGAQFLVDLLARRGIEAQMELLGDKDANVWAVLEGQDPKAIVLHHHIDVEDVLDPERWAFSPFSGQIDLPWLYGRGSFDMKSVAIAQLLAFARLKESGKPLRKSVILLATTGEETGSELGTQWILRQHPELVARFDVVFTEGGVLEGRSSDNLKYWGTEFAQKRFTDVMVCSPSRDQLEALRADVGEFGRPWDSPLFLPAEVAAFLPTYAPTRDRPDFREWMKDPASLLRDRAAVEQLPAYVQAMFRPELYAGPVVPATGGGYQMAMKVHLPAGTTLDQVRDVVLPRWLLHGLSYSVYQEPSAEHGSPLDHPALREINRALDESYPDVPKGPVFLSWTLTDSRFFRARGIPSYGFSPFVVLTTDAMQIGGAYERIALPGYVEGVGIYQRVLERLAL